jgi:hypothetical protein
MDCVGQPSEDREAEQRSTPSHFSKNTNAQSSHSMNRMKKLEPSQVSPPVRTSFGWHLIEVLERRKQDVTIDRARSEAQTAIRQRKADEAFQDWVRQVRDKAFVEIRLDDR